jgi:hypothetical protein
MSKRLVVGIFKQASVPIQFVSVGKTHNKPLTFNDNDSPHIRIVSGLSNQSRDTHRIGREGKPSRSGRTVWVDNKKNVEYLFCLLQQYKKTSVRIGEKRHVQCGVVVVVALNVC